MQRSKKRERGRQTLTVLIASLLAVSCIAWLDRIGSTRIGDEVEKSEAVLTRWTILVV